MAIFDESELNEIDIDQLLGINFEKFGNWKEKLERITEYVKNAQGEWKNEALAILKNKVSQIDNNIQNIDNISANIENIDKIIYGEKETKIIFQMK